MIAKHQRPFVPARRAVLLGITALAALPSPALAQSGPALERLRRSGAKVGFANEFPFAFRTPEGQVAGAEYEVARAVFARLGVSNLEPIVTEFRALIPGLQASRFDVIVAGLVIQPARCEQVLFSEPNMRTQWTALVARGNPKRIHGFEDIARDRSLKIAALQGTAAARIVQASGVAESQLTLFPAFPEALAALRTGRVDAMTTLSATAGDYVRGDTTGRIERANPFRAPVVDGKPVVNHSAFAFRREDADLLAAFNPALAAVMGSADRRAIFERYGLTEDEVPRGVTTQDLCRAS